MKIEEKDLKRLLNTKLEQEIRNTLWQLGIEDEQIVVDVLKDLPARVYQEQQSDLWQEAFDIITEREFKGQPFMDELERRFTIIPNPVTP